MPKPTGYALLVFMLVAFYLPMPIIYKLFTLMAFIAAPLLARATSEDAAEIVIDTTERFACFVVLLVFVILVRLVNDILCLTSLPGRAFEFLSS